jgi:hypothetical protein
LSIHPHDRSEFHFKCVLSHPLQTPAAPPSTSYIFACRADRLSRHSGSTHSELGLAPSALDAPSG